MGVEEMWPVAAHHTHAHTTLTWQVLVYKVRPGTAAIRLPLLAASTVHNPTNARTRVASKN